MLPLSIIFLAVLGICQQFLQTSIMEYPPITERPYIKQNGFNSHLYTVWIWNGLETKKKGLW